MPYCVVKAFAYHLLTKLITRRQDLLNDFLGETLQY